MDKIITNRGDEFLSNTGILLEEHIWFYSESLYLGPYETFLIDKSGKKIRSFKEVPIRVKIIYTLKYKYIINWDFEEKIEYEPVFYTKYKYNDERLYEEEIIAHNYYDIGNENHTFFYLELSSRNKVNSNFSIKYFYLLFRGFISSRFNKK